MVPQWDLDGSGAFSGDPQSALTALPELLARQEQALGVGHPDALLTRNNLAIAKGQVGNAPEAVNDLSALLAQAEPLLGETHPIVLTIRDNLAGWTGMTGDVHGALVRFEEVLAIRERTQGPDHPATLSTRRHLEDWTNTSQSLPHLTGLSQSNAHGVVVMAMSWLFSIEAQGWEQEEVQAYARRSLSSHLVAMGDFVGAVRVLELLSDRLRPSETQERWRSHLPQILAGLGPSNPAALKAREYTAVWRGDAGDATGAANDLDQLFRDELALLGEHDEATLLTGIYLARFRNRAQRPHEGLELLEWLIPTAEEALGPQHRVTFEARKERASLYGAIGLVAQARGEYENLIVELTRDCDPFRTDILHVHINLGMWRQRADDPVAAKAGLTQVLPYAVAAWGDADPRVLTALEVLADCEGDLGDADAAAQGWRELIAIRTQISGLEHPNTLGARARHAYWLGRTGDRASAETGFIRLLPDLVRVLGAEHSHTQFVTHALDHLQRDAET